MDNLVKGCLSFSIVQRFVYEAELNGLLIALEKALYLEGFLN